MLDCNQLAEEIHLDILGVKDWLHRSSTMRPKRSDYDIERYQKKLHRLKVVEKVLLFIASRPGTEKAIMAAIIGDQNGDSSGNHE